VQADLYDAGGVGWSTGDAGDAAWLGRSLGWGDGGDAAWLGRTSIDDAGFSLGDIGRAIGGAAKAVGGWVREHDPVGHIAMQIGRGERVDRAFLQGGKLAVESIKEAAPYIEMALANLPGIGTGISSALAMAIALASGHGLTDAAMEAAIAATPGGPLAQRAMRASLSIVSGLASGKRIDKVMLETMRAQLPNQAAKAAFDAGVALAAGRKIQEVAAKALGTLGEGKLPGGRFGNAAVNAASEVLAGHRVDRVLLAQGMRVVHDVATKMPAVQKVSALADQISARKVLGLTTGVLGSPRITSAIGAAVSSSGMGNILDSRLTTVAKALLERPALRALPIYDLAKRLGVSENFARQGMASVLEAVRRVGAVHAPLVLPRLAHAPELARGLGDVSFDQALARFASNVAPVSYSASPARFVATPGLDRVRWRGMNRTVLEHMVRRVPALRALTPSQIRALSLLSHPAVTDASGLDATGSKYVVEPGDFATKIAQKLVRNGNRWPELVAANPQKARTAADGNFKSLLPGEVLNLPASWTGGAPSAPSMPQLPPGPSPTTGLVSSGRYVVQAGDFATKIAQRLVNDGRRWPELVAANPQKKTNAADGNFASLLPGEVINLPASWVAGGAPSSPSAPLPSTQGTTARPRPGFDARVLQVQGMLGLWSTANDAGNPARFGSNPSTDADGVFGPRTQGTMGKFQRWANANAGKALRTDGTIDDASYQALVEWTARQVTGVPTSAPSGPIGFPSPGGFPTSPGGGDAPLPSLPVGGPQELPPGAGAPQKGSGGGMGLAIAAGAALFLLAGDKT
jgi:LysM repeat protein